MKKQLTKGQQKRKLQDKLQKLIANNKQDCFCSECEYTRAEISKLKIEINKLQ